MKHIMRCQVCHKYTIKEICCDEKTIPTKPAKYSPEDKYAKYRRIAKESKGLI